ncbi:NADH:ubiquinone oxidoreductase subunit N [Achromatium sp. WMS2]|nr:NADH:ubiquinone oxidoreductase subunit N [Achromatium sp. WMS2]
MFTLEALVALLPLLIVCATVVVVMLAIAFKRNHSLVAGISIGGLILALLGVFAAESVGPQAVTEIMMVDRISWFYSILIIISALTSSIFSYSYLEEDPINREEIYLLVLMALAGGMVLISSNHAAMFFLGLEILSVSVYGITAYLFTNKLALEAGIKYLVLSATASATLLFGFALLYSQSGELGFSGIGAYLAIYPSDQVALVGLTMVLIAIMFKLSLAPFHFWVPDVYQGSSAPAGAFIATEAKISVFVVLLRLVQSIPLLQSPGLALLLTIVAIASIIVGNLLALQQNNIKRLLAYSSVAHFGYLLIVLTVVPGPLVEEAVGMYLLTYMITTLTAFGVVTMASSRHEESDTCTITEYCGLFWSRPVISVVLSICMLSLAGIPLTAGFIGKFYVIAVGINSQLWVALGALLVGSAIGIFYYLRIMVNLYMKVPEAAREIIAPTWKYSTSGITLLVLAASIILLGIYPHLALSWLALESF